MHIALVVSSLAAAIIAACAMLSVLHRVTSWERRRVLQLSVLVAPLISLGLIMAVLHHFSEQICLIGAARWDYLVGSTLPMVMAGIALLGVALGFVRLLLASLSLTRRALPADASVERMVDRLASAIGARRPRVRVSPIDDPLALTFGLLRPTVMVSQWMLTHLDERELEAVLAHELGHVARRDYLLAWLATMLRDAFCYLPTSWMAHLQLQRERELACDDLAAAGTGRPLALAGALAAIWHYRVLPPGPQLAVSLAGEVESLEDRINRLLDRAPERAEPRTRMTLAFGAAPMVLVLGIEAGIAALFLATMGCGPALGLAGML